MSGIDKVFEKSELSESKKKSKMVFGKLLISLRKSGSIKLYSLLGSVADTDLENNSLKLIFKDKGSYDMINNPHDIEGISTILKEIDNDLILELDCLEKSHLDEFKFEEFLKAEFGKLLTIK